MTNLQPIVRSWGCSITCESRIQNRGMYHRITTTLTYTQESALAGETARIRASIEDLERYLGAVRVG